MRKLLIIIALVLILFIGGHYLVYNDTDNSDPAWVQAKQNLKDSDRALANSMNDLLHLVRIPYTITLPD